MQQFDLEEYLKNPDRKIITRDGRSVRIVCTDLKGTEFPIIALYEDGRHECFDTYRPNGRSCDYYEFDTDLFFASENEKEKNKHQGWINIYDGAKNANSSRLIYDTKEEALSCASKDRVDTIKIEWEE